MTGVRLVWDGKDTPTTRVRLPLQVVETVNASRADRGAFSFAAEREDGWHNQLIWGDNLNVLHSLADTLAGQVDLIYIDPPFDSQQDYQVEVGVGDLSYEADYEKLQSIIEEKAYRDTWGRGRSSYLQMIYDRLIVARRLLSPSGSLVVHVDWHQSHYLKLLLDEVMGEKNFRNEIVWWYYNKYQGNIRRFASNHDVLLWYSKSDSFKFNRQHEQRDSPIKQIKRVWDKTSQKLVNAKDPETGKVQYQESTTRTVDDVWRIPMLQPADRHENVRFQTQKPLALAERLIGAFTEPDDVVVDFFCGSGTCAVAAERLGRRWVAVDMGRFAIHTTRKRLLDIPNCSPFTVANLGSYERQAWQQAMTGETVQAYLDFVARLYGASPLGGSALIHAAKGPVAVHVGAIDAPVSLAEVKETLDEAVASGYQAIDVLGWDFDLGLHDVVTDEAESRGVRLRLRYIPGDVMDPRAANDVVFHELAYLAIETTVERHSVAVTLTDFVLPHPELVPTQVRNKITAWSDYIDYWAVDFTYDGDGDTFRNQWQSYRTRADRTLELTATHDYDEPGLYTVLVKAVDIFGNDTTVAVEVRVPA